MDIYIFFNGSIGIKNTYSNKNDIKITTKQNFLCQKKDNNNLLASQLKTVIFSN